MAANVKEFCCMHIFDHKLPEKITPFSQVSFAKYIAYLERWKSISEWHRAARATAKARKKFNTDNWKLFSDLPSDATYGFHRKCYSRYTCKSDIERAEKRQAKIEEHGLPEPAPSPGTSRIVQVKTKVLKKKRKPSGPRKLIPEGQPRCIICKAELTVRNPCTQKRIKEPLSTCRTEQALSSLRKGACILGRDDLVSQLEGLDHKETNVTYHRSCFRNLVTRNRTKSTSGEQPHQRAYEEFCRVYIDGKIIEQNKRFLLTTLAAKFTKMVRKIEGGEIDKRYTARLKERLGKSHPQLEYYMPKQRNRCMVVMFRSEADRKLPEDQCDFEKEADCDASSDSEDDSMVNGDDDPLNGADDELPTIDELIAMLADPPVGDEVGSHSSNQETKQTFTHEDHRYAIDESVDAVRHIDGLHGEDIFDDSFYKDDDKDEDYIPEGYDSASDYITHQTEKLLPHQEIYEMSKKMRKVIEMVSPLKNVPSQAEMDDGVPFQLYNLLAWLTGFSVDQTRGKRVALPGDQDRVISLMSQYIVNKSMDHKDEARSMCTR